LKKPDFSKEIKMKIKNDNKSIKRLYSDKIKTGTAREYPPAGPVPIVSYSRNRKPAPLS
jgi:ribosomal protein S19E (S16A)